MGSGHCFVFNHGQMVNLAESTRNCWYTDFDSDGHYSDDDDFNQHEAFKKANFGAIFSRCLFNPRNPGALIGLVSPKTSFLGIETQLETILRSNSSLQEMAARIAAAPLSLDSTSVVLFRIPEP